MARKGRPITFSDFVAFKEAQIAEVQKSKSPDKEKDRLVQNLERQIGRRQGECADACGECYWCFYFGKKGAA